MQKTMIVGGGRKRILSLFCERINSFAQQNIFNLCWHQAQSRHRDDPDSFLLLGHHVMLKKKLVKFQLISITTEIRDTKYNDWTQVEKSPQDGAWFIHRYRGIWPHDPDSSFLTRTLLSHHSCIPAFYPLI